MRAILISALVTLAIAAGGAAQPKAPDTPAAMWKAFSYPERLAYLRGALDMVRSSRGVTFVIEHPLCASVYVPDPAPFHDRLRAYLPVAGSQLDRSMADFILDVLDADCSPPKR